MSNFVSILYQKTSSRPPNWMKSVSEFPQDRLYCNVFVTKMYCMQVKCICPYYFMYTERKMLFPSPFTFVHTKVAPPLSPISLPILYVSNCRQDDITSQHFSLSVRLKKPRPLLLRHKQIEQEKYLKGFNQK